MLAKRNCKQKWTQLVQLAGRNPVRACPADIVGAVRRSRKVVSERVSVNVV